MNAMTTKLLHTFSLCALSAVVTSFSSLSVAADTSDLAKAAQNPVANMISLPLQNNTNFKGGPLERTQNILNIQPVYPISLSEDWNLITRTILPVVSQPGLTGIKVVGDEIIVDPEGKVEKDRTFGLGDTTFTAFFSPKDSGKLTWGVGPVLLLPTATDDALGSDKWGLGPSAVLLTMPGNWVVGSLFSNLWSVGGSGDQDINLFTWQYFINYNIPDGNGLYLTSAPIIPGEQMMQLTMDYDAIAKAGSMLGSGAVIVLDDTNWEAESDNRWTVPFGGGIGKIFKIGKQPVNAQVSAYYNVEKPEYGPDWQLRLQMQFLFPK